MDAELQSSIVALLSLIISSVTAVAIAFITYKTNALGREATRTNNHIKQTQAVVNDIAASTGDKFDKLLTLTQETSKAEGKAEQKKDDLDRINGVIK